MNKNVSIIGGSSAGLFAAYQLAKEGLPVSVYEAAGELNPAPRTLIVTHHFKSFLDDFSDSIVINKIKRFELFANGRVASVPLSDPDLIIDRKRLIRTLAHKARSLGAQIHYGHRFLNLEPNGKKIRFRVTRNGTKSAFELAADAIIGADGTFSQVARSVNIPPPPTVPLVQAVVHLPVDLSPDTTRVWFLPEETRYFYWLIPHSANRGVLGLIGDDRHDTKHILEHFLERKGIVPLEFQSGRIPEYQRWIPNHIRVGNNSVYLVGDAAGHVKVTTVGGIVTGLHGALGTVDAITNGGSNRKFNRLKKELDRHRLIRKVLNRFCQNDYIRLLNLLTPVTKRVLSLITRDETNKLLFPLLRRQPRFLLFGVRSIISLLRSLF